MLGCSNLICLLFPDIPSPTRKKGSTSTSEDCVVPDIDDEDNVFNFEQPRVPAGKEENYKNVYLNCFTIITNKYTYTFMQHFIKLVITTCHSINVA